METEGKFATEHPTGEAEAEARHFTTTLITTGTIATVAPEKTTATTARTTTNIATAATKRHRPCHSIKYYTLQKQK